MLSNLGAKERNLWEYNNLLDRSGYEFKHLYKTDGPVSIIEATITANQE